MVNKLIQTTLVLALLLLVTNKVFAQCPNGSTPTTLTSTHVTCNGANDGTITVDVTLTGTITFFLYDITSGSPQLITTSTGTATTVNFASLPPRTYLVNIRLSGCNGPSDFKTVGGFGIFIDEPVAPNAGLDQLSLCNVTSFTLAGNDPAPNPTLVTSSTALWTMVSGPNVPIITSPTTQLTTITGAVVGTYTFDLTFSHAGCTDLVDQVIIVNNPAPTPADAGSDQAVCVASTTLAGNIPVTGVGTWSVISGTGIFNPSDVGTATVTGLSSGENVFRWTISSPSCTDSFDDVTIAFDVPTTSDAGLNQDICGTSATLAGNIPVTGVGTWSVISGTATFADANLGTTTVSSLSASANVLRWTIGNGLCPNSTSDVTITPIDPSTSVAGPNQAVCATSTTLAGNVPVTGIGTWSVVSGSAAFANANLATSTVSALAAGDNILRWTIGSGACPSSASDVTITNNNPSASDAGVNQNICAASTTLAANVPAFGTGTWSVIVGTGIVTTPSVNASDVTNLSIGNNIFRWTISNAPCPDATDDITVVVAASPTVADAGLDQSVCTTVATMTGNTPLVGTGTWTKIGGPAGGTITTPNNPLTTITALNTGTYTYRWTIANAPCTSSTDDMSLVKLASPTANAGANQNICTSSSTTLNATAPPVGVGTWTLVSGTGTITNPALRNTTVTGISVGTSTFRWTVSNGLCPDAVATVTVTRIISLTPSSAGPPQTICASTTVMAANSPPPGTGTGAWSKISGLGTVSTPANPLTNITAISAAGVSVFRWRISNPGCTASDDFVTITRSAAPSAAAAGSDQSICGTSTTLAATTPIVGTGSWTVVSGTGTVTSVNSPTSTVTGITGPSLVLSWTVSNAPCVSTGDIMTITVLPSPTTAAAGSNQILCANSTTLAANVPVTGVGTWSVISGTATFASTNLATTTVSALALGDNVLRWTIGNGICPNSASDVTITNNQPSVSDAGPNQSICGTSSTLAGNVPVTGVGTWSVVSGSATFANANLATSTVSTLSAGDNILRWTIGNGGCTSSTDDVTVTSTGPSTSVAGPNQSICSTSATLAANVPVTGVGTWSVVSGSGTFANANLATSNVSALAVGNNILRWTIGSGLCPTSASDVTITRSSPPTVSDAGPNQNFCGTSTTLAANVPVTGIGTWSVVSGTGTFANANLATSTVSALSAGNNILRWTIGNGACTTSTDDVTISNNAPSTSVAGPNQSICSTSTTLAANIPVTGVGTWSVVSGSATFASTNLATSTVSALAAGNNILRWTIGSGLCPTSTSDVTINRSAPPTVSDAGPNQNFCGTSTTLAANVPVTGIGTWSLVSGTATFANPNLATSTVSALAAGDNILRWTIGNGVCTNSTDDVTISNNGPSTAVAGVNQSICATSTTLTGNIPATGVGTWSVISGTATFANINLGTSSVSALSAGDNVLRWTIGSGVCPNSTSDVTVTNNTPSTAIAGSNQSICTSTSTLAGNVPVTGIGTWSVVSGSATFANANLATSNVSALSAGNTILRWTIGSGSCPTSTSDVTVTNNEPSTAVAGANQSICTSTTTLAGNVPVTGIGTWSVVSGSATFANANLATSTVSALSAGNTILRWTIGNGLCPNSSSDVLVTNNEPSTAVAGANQSICTTSTTLAGNVPVTGVGTWSVVSGTGTFANANLATSTVSALAAGNTILRWTIGSGMCPTSTSDVTVTNNEPTTAVAGANQSICATSTTLTGNIPVTGVGTWSVVSGTATFSTINLGTSSVSALSNGDNILRWTIGSGLCPTSTSDVTVTSNIPPTVSDAGTNQTFCGTSTTLSGNIPVTGIGTWSIISGSAVFSSTNVATTTVSALATGVNVLRWTIGNGLCANSSADVTITANPIVLATITATTSPNPCGSATGGANVLAGGGNGVFVYSWNSIPAQTSSALTGVIAGVYTVVVTDGNLCSANVNAIITDASAPIVTLLSDDADNIICSNTTIVFTPSGADNYSYFMDGSPVGTANTTLALQVDTMTVNHSITVTGLSTLTGCTGVSNAVIITVLPSVIPSITITAPLGVAVCAGSPVDFVAITNNGGANPIFNWKVNGVSSGSASTFTSSALVNGDVVECEMTSNATCIVGPALVTSTILTISIYASPVVSITTDAVPSACTASDGALTAVAVSGSSPFSFNWGTTITSTNSSVTGLSGGTYIVTLTDNNGCSATSTLALVSIGATSYTLTSDDVDNVICSGSTILFTALPASVNSTYTFSVNGNSVVSSTINTFSTSVLNNGDVVSVQVDDGLCIGVSSPLTVTVVLGTSTNVVITASTDSICFGQRVDFASVINPAIIVTYSWKVDGVIVAGSDLSTFSSVTLTNNQAVSLEVTYLSCGAITTSTSNLISIAVISPPIPTITLSKKNRICFGDTLTMISSSAVDNVWSTSQTTKSIVVGTSGTYHVTVANSNGCSSKSADVIVTVGEKLNLTVTSPIFEGGYNVSKHNIPDGSIDLTVSGGFAPYRYFWSNLASTEDISNVAPNNYHVVVADEINCLDTAYIVLTNPPALELPTVFTPNDDGQNDFFVIKGLEVYPGTSVHIYNRWGNSVFESLDYKNEWNGSATSSGKVPDGTYFVVAVVKETDGTEIVLKGYIELRTDLK